MALTAANILTGKTGALYYAAAGTTLPENPTVALDAAFTAGELGYLNEDGWTQSVTSETTDIQAWQNGDVVLTVQTSHLVTFNFTMLETNPTTLDVYYGDYTDNGTYSTVRVRGDQDTRGAWVFDVIDGANLIRTVIPDGKRTANGDVVYQNGVPVQYPITITAFPDTSSNKAYQYYNTSGAS